MADTVNRKKITTKNIVALIILVLTLNSVYGQTSDTIYWKSDYTLKYKDFLAKPDSSKIDLANSYMWISYKYKIVDGIILYTSDAYFLKKISWAKLDFEPLLDHEQTHFDIYKLYALKFLDTLYKLNLPIKNLDNNLKLVFNSITQQATAMNNLYDKIEKEGSSKGTGKPQQKFHKEIRRQIQNLQGQVEKRTHNMGFAASVAGRC